MTLILPKAQLASFTGHGQNVRWQNVGIRVNNQFIDTTGVSPSGVADQINRYCEGFDVVQFVASGTITDSAGTACSKAQEGWLAPGKYAMKPSRWSIQRRWELEDITGTTMGVPDDDKVYGRSGFPLVLGNAAGFLLADGPPTDLKTQNLVMDIDLVGRFEGGSIVRNSNTNVRFFKGGEIPTAFNYQFTTGYEFTPATAGQWAIFEETNPDLLEAELTVDLDTGQTITQNSALEQIALSNIAARGGPVQVQAVWRLTANVPTGNPADPSNLTATTPSAGMALVAWTDGDDSVPHGTIIESRINGSGDPFVQVGLVGPGVTSFKDYGVTAGITYDYQIQHVNRANNRSAVVGPASILVT